MRIDRKHREGAVEMLELWASNPMMSRYDLVTTALYTEPDERRRDVDGYRRISLGGWSGWSEDVAELALVVFADPIVAAQHVASGWTPRAGWAIACRLARYGHTTSAVSELRNLLA